MPDKINNELAKLFKLGDKFGDKVARTYEKRLLKLYRQSLKNIQRQIALVYERYGDKATLGELVAYNRLTNLEVWIKTELTKLGRSTGTQINQMLKGSVINDYNYVGFVTERTFQRKLNFTQLSNAKIKAALINPMDRVSAFQRNAKNVTLMYDKVKNSITQGIIEGKGYGNTASLVRKTMNNSFYQAKRIVWTESHRAQNAGRIAGFDAVEDAAAQNGIKISRVWIATLDEKTRPSHRNMDQVKANNKTKKFRYVTMKGVVIQVDAPGLIGIAEEDINCRCTTAIQADDVPIKVRKDNITKQIIPQTNYNDWYRNKYGVNPPFFNN